MRNNEITRNDIEVAMCADKVLMDMFYPDQDVSLSGATNEVDVAKIRDSVSKNSLHFYKQHKHDTLTAGARLQLDSSLYLISFAL